MLFHTAVLFSHFIQHEDLHIVHMHSHEQLHNVCTVVTIYTVVNNLCV